MISELPGQDVLVPEMKCDSIKMCDLLKEPTWFWAFVVLDLFVGNKWMRTRFWLSGMSLKSKATVAGNSCSYQAFGLLVHV